MAARLTGRLAGVDLARALALLGMVSVHVFPSVQDDGGTSVPHLVASGRASALFAVLAGVGLALLTGGRRPVTGAARWRATRSIAVRCACVALVGLVLGQLDSGVAVILVHYGLLFALALPVLGLRPPALAGLSLGVAVVMPFALFAVRDRLPRLGDNPSLELLLTQPGDLLSTLLLTGYYPVAAWAAYLFAGLAVGRLPLRDRRTAVALTLGGALLAAVALAASEVLLQAEGLRQIASVTDVPPGRTLEEVVSGNQFGDVPTDTAWWLATIGPHSTTPLDLLHTTGTSLAVLGTCLLVAQVAPAVLVAPLVAAGTMTLTLYSVHVVVLAATSGEDPATLYAVQVVAGLAFALLWTSTVGRGPLEAAVAVAAGRAGPLVAA